MANYSISQLPTEATAQSTDLIETAIVDANSASGYASRKETLAAVGEAVVSDFQFPLLLTETTAKTITGAINEVAQNAGGNVADEIANLKKSTDATIAGGVATFDALDSLPLDALTIGIEYTQSGSGTPSPDNVRTFSGFANAAIFVTDGDTTETKTISFGAAGTVYGGTLDVLTGELTVTHTILNGSDFTWSYTASSHRHYTEAFNNDNTYKQERNGTTIKCSCYKEGNAYAGTINLTCCLLSRIWIYDEDISEADFLALVQTAQFLVEYTTPLTYQLTSTEIKSLIGSNTVWADCGDVTICKYTALERIENQVTQYSTAEQKTGKKWIDGKDIYIKVIDFGALPNATSKSVAHGITDLEDVVTLRGIATNPNNGIRILLPYPSTAALAETLQLRVDDTNVVINTGYNYSSAYTATKVIIEYTKTN